MGAYEAATGAVQRGPPGEEDLGHEIEDELLGLLRRMHRREQPGHLAERPQLENGVVQRALPLEQDAPELEDHRQADRERRRHATHLRGDRLVGQDQDLGVAVLEAGDLDRLGAAIGRTDGGRFALRRQQREPDPVALEPLHQRHPATLEQLSVGAGEPAGSGKGAGDGGKRGGRRGTHCRGR